MIEMPFGKYKGRPIQSLSKGYLIWLMGNCDMRGELAKAVQCAIDDIPYRQPQSIDDAIESMIAPFEEQ